MVTVIFASLFGCFLGIAVFFFISNQNWGMVFLCLAILCGFVNLNIWIQR